MPCNWQEATSETKVQVHAAESLPTKTQLFWLCGAPHNRRNWLFVGSNDGARVNTVFVSLLASARLHDIEPLAYIRDLFCLLPAWPHQRVLELAPAYWKKTLEQPETQEKLSAKVFRRVVLQPPV
jgi:transposase